MGQPKKKSGHGEDPIRLYAISSLVQILNGTLRPKAALKSCRSQDAPKIQEKIYGVLRSIVPFEKYLRSLLPKPLKPKDRDVWVILLLALHELAQGEPEYAVVDSYVRTLPAKKSWAKGLVNGVLREWIREKDAIEKSFASDPGVQTGLPDWIRTRIEALYPEEAQAVYATLNAYPPPMGLRVNLSKCLVQDYVEALKKQGLRAVRIPDTRAGFYLETPIPAVQLPGWKKGWVAIQDGAAQMAAEWLDLTPQLKVLDACAAPGGKTGAIKNVGLDIELTALEVDPKRFLTLKDNLRKWGLLDQVKLVRADFVEWALEHPESFDRILVDAPCSSSGVIRRHPDIRLKDESELKKTTATQLQVLNSAWKALKTGGKLLYVTCSLFEEENDEVIEAFLEQVQGAAQLELIDTPIGKATRQGRQILPGGYLDGLYYARILKVR